MEYSFYKNSINPKEKVNNLAGFPKRNKSTKVLGVEDLYLKILWLKDKETNHIIITLDTLYFPTDIASIIFKYLYITYRISKESILLNASHTHSAPNVSFESFGRIDHSYIHEIADKIVVGLDNCYSNFQDCYIDYDNLSCDYNLFINRRKRGRDIRSLFIKRRTIMLPNEERKVDNNIRILKIYNTEMEIEGLMYNLSCHPVFNTSNHCTSDFVVLQYSYRDLQEMFDQTICKQKQQLKTLKII